MNQLSEDRLGTLGDHLVAGPHTPSHIVMTRGRSIRRRRQLGGGAALAAAASVTAVLGPNVLSRHGTGLQTTNPAVSAPPAITEPEAPCAPSKHIAQSLTPQQIPDVIYLLKSPPSKAVSAGISGSALMCNDRVISGADISATGVVEQSFRLTYSGIPVDPNFFPANPDWPRETVRGTEGDVNADTVRWVENGRLWSWAELRCEQAGHAGGDREPPA